MHHPAWLPWACEVRFYPHITNKNTGSEKLNDVPIVTQLVIHKPRSPHSNGYCFFSWALLPPRRWDHDGT